MSDSKSTIEKGNRNENQAKDILKRVYGAGVEKVNSWGNHDLFGLIDLIAIKPDKPVKFIQVKTNSFPPKTRKKYIQKARNIPLKHVEFEVWVRIDRVGWNIYKFKDNQFIKTYEIHVCNTKDAGENYKEICN